MGKYNFRWVFTIMDKVEKEQFGLKNDNKETEALRNQLSQAIILKDQALMERDRYLNEIMS